MWVSHWHCPVETPDHPPRSPHPEPSNTWLTETSFFPLAWLKSSHLPLFLLYPMSSFSENPADYSLRIYPESSHTSLSAQPLSLLPGWLQPLSTLNLAPYSLFQHHPFQRDHLKSQVSSRHLFAPHPLQFLSSHGGNGLQCPTCLITPRYPSDLSIQD